MKAYLLILPAIAAAVVALAPGAAAGASRCRGEPVAKTRQIVVFAKRGRSFYAWVRRTGKLRSFTVEDREQGPLIRNVTASGRFVAWEERGGRTEPYSIVCVYDAIKGGRGRRCFNAMTDSPSGGKDPLAPHQVARLIVTSSGNLAWTADNQFADPPRPEVLKADATGRTLLDAGAGVNRSSLRVSGTSIFWLNGDEQKSATFASG